MAATMAAPRDGSSIVGTAYRANLISVHHAEAVLQVFGSVAWEAIRIAASHLEGSYPNRRIVTMAFEADDGYNHLREEIRYWEARNRLFVGASGMVDYAGIKFPASMPEVMAVAVVGSGYQEIWNVDYGSEVEVAMVETQLSAGPPGHDLQSLSLTSGATAVVSGIAALVWSRYPTETNDQIRARLHQAGHRYPAHDRVGGYGVVNALKAVGGLYSMTIGTVMIAGSPKSQTETWRLSASPLGGDGPYTYQWSNGSSATWIDVTVSVCASPVSQYVTITDTSDGVQQIRQVTIYPSQSGSC